MKIGFTFYHAGRDYFVPYENKTYRTKAIAERIVKALGHPTTAENVEYIRTRIRHCTCEVRENRNGNQVVLIHGSDFAIVDPEHETVFLQ